jgi:hypothetical protein
LERLRPLALVSQKAGVGPESSIPRPGFSGRVPVCPENCSRVIKSIVGPTPGWTPSTARSASPLWPTIQSRTRPRMPPVLLARGRFHPGSRRWSQARVYLRSHTPVRLHYALRLRPLRTQPPVQPYQTGARRRVFDLATRTRDKVSASSRVQARPRADQSPTSRSERADVGRGSPSDRADEPHPEGE